MRIPGKPFVRRREDFLPKPVKKPPEIKGFVTGDYFPSSGKYPRYVIIVFDDGESIKYNMEVENS